MILEIFLIIIGFILLVKGADFLVEGSSSIAKRFHIPDIIIGLTIVSIGTSMPELFVGITSSINNHSDLVIGNVIGSNVCNLLLILGLSAIIKTIKFQKETRLIEIPTYLIITILFMCFCNSGEVISRIEGFIFLLLFLVFIAYTIFMGIREEKLYSEKKEKKKKYKSNIIKNIVYIIVGIVALKFGGDFAVNNSVLLAERFNISEKIIGLTIVAIGTSLPELVTSIMASAKGNSDIAIGNIIGSNIFNMLLIVGVSSIINPITYNTSYNIDLTISLIGTLFLLIFSYFPRNGEMGKKNGLLYLLFYTFYLITMFYI